MSRIHTVVWEHQPSRSRQEEVQEQREAAFPNGGGLTNRGSCSRGGAEQGEEIHRRLGARGRLPIKTEKGASLSEVGGD